VIDHPVIARPVRSLRDNGAQRGRAILPGTRHPKIPDPLARGDDAGGQERPPAMADICMLAFLWLAGLGHLGGILALQNLHRGVTIIGTIMEIFR